MSIGRALALTVLPAGLALGCLTLAPATAMAQTPTTAAEDDPEPDTPASPEAIDDRRAESRKRRKSVVIPNRPGPASEVGDPEETDEERELRQEREDREERRREREEDDEDDARGGGTNWRAVGIGLTVSGLVVGLAGGGLGIAGGVTGDEPTQIAAACVGLTGSALAVAGLIVALTAPSPVAVARTSPTFTIGIGPGSAAAFVSF